MNKIHSNNLEIFQQMTSSYEIPGLEQGLLARFLDVLNAPI